MRHVLLSLAIGALGLLAGLSLAAAAGWLPGSDPVVVAAVAFVAGGIFTAIVDLAARELSAYTAERRQRRRELRDLHLLDINTTQRWVLNYADYARRVWYDEQREWPAENELGVRAALIAHEEVLDRFMKALDAVIRRDPDHPAVVRQMVELRSAEEAVHRALNEQHERVIAGEEPLIIDETTVDRLTSSVEQTRAIYRGMGLAEQDQEPG